MKKVVTKISSKAGKEFDKAFKKMSEAMDEASSVFDSIDWKEMSTVEQDGIKVEIANGIVSISGTPKKVVLNDEELKIGKS